VTGPGTPPVTAVFVVYGTAELDLAWIPPSVPVIVVHNDRSLDPSVVDHPGARHVLNETNVGFGAAVNVALELVPAGRLVVANPDIDFGPGDWPRLATGDADEIRTIPLVDRLGRPTWEVNPYPTPASLLLTAYRVGRLLRRWPGLRRRAGRLLGAWGKEHTELRGAGAGVWPLATHWVSGAAFSVDVERLRAVGGFDGGYFLYLEDTDLCARLAARFPAMRALVVAGPPAVHAVGGSAHGAAARRTVDRHHLASCRRYASGQTGPAWRLCAALLAPRAWWLGRAR
jgi:hypothetical protein